MDLVTSTTDSAKEFFTSLSFDVIVLGALTGLFFLIGFRAGKTRLINLVFSFYLTTLLILFFPFKHLITFDFGLLFGKYDIVGLLLFLIVSGIVQVVVGYVLELEFGERAFRNTMNNIVLSFSASIALIAGAYITSVVKVTDLTGASFIDALYTNEQYLFALLVLPLIGVFIVAR